MSAAVYAAACGRAGVEPALELILSLGREEVDGHVECAMPDRRRAFSAAEMQAAGEGMLAAKRVSSIDLSGNAMDVQCAAPLAEVLRRHGPSLERLRLGSNALGDEGAMVLCEALGQAGALRELDLQDNGVGSDGIRALGAAVGGGGAALSLNLSSNLVDDMCAVELCKQLQRSRVSRLSLRFNSVGNEGAAALASLLAPRGPVEALDVGGNNVGLPGATLLAAAVRGGRVMKLNIRSNSIGDEGLRAVADAVAAPGSKVEGLFVGHNGTTVNGVTKALLTLSNALQLRRLDLQGPSLGAAGVEAAAALIGRLPRLEELVIDLDAENPLVAEGLAEAACRSSTLEELNLGFEEDAPGVLPVLLRESVSVNRIAAELSSDSPAVRAVRADRASVSLSPFTQEAAADTLRMLARHSRALQSELDHTDRSPVRLCPHSPGYFSPRVPAVAQSSHTSPTPTPIPAMPGSPAAWMRHAGAPLSARRQSPPPNFSPRPSPGRQHQPPPAPSPLSGTPQPAPAARSPQRVFPAQYSSGSPVISEKTQEADTIHRSVHQSTVQHSVQQSMHSVARSGIVSVSESNAMSTPVPPTIAVHNSGASDARVVFLEEQLRGLHSTVEVLRAERTADALRIARIEQTATAAASAVSAVERELAATRAELNVASRFQEDTDSARSNTLSRLTALEVELAEQRAEAEKLRATLRRVEANTEDAEEISGGTAGAVEKVREELARGMQQVLTEQERIRAGVQAVAEAACEPQRVGLEKMREELRELHTTCSNTRREVEVSRERIEVRVREAEQRVVAAEVLTGTTRDSVAVRFNELSEERSKVDAASAELARVELEVARKEIGTLQQQVSGLLLRADEAAAAKSAAAVARKVGTEAKEGMEQNRQHLSQLRQKLTEVSVRADAADELTAQLRKQGRQAWKPVTERLGERIDALDTRLSGVTSESQAAVQSVREQVTHLRTVSSVTNNTTTHINTERVEAVEALVHRCDEDMSYMRRLLIGTEPAGAGGLFAPVRQGLEAAQRTGMQHQDQLTALGEGLGALATAVQETRDVAQRAADEVAQRKNNDSKLEELRVIVQRSEERYAQEQTLRAAAREELAEEMERLRQDTTQTRLMAEKLAEALAPHVIATQNKVDRLEGALRRDHEASELALRAIMAEQKEVSSALSVADQTLAGSVWGGAKPRHSSPHRKAPDVLDALGEISRRHHGRSTVEWEQAMRTAFARADTRRRGKVARGDLMSHLGECFAAERPEWAGRLLQRVSAERAGGVVSWSEFEAQSRTCLPGGGGGGGTPRGTPTRGTPTRRRN
eukprot:Hpha_TRINITY_DN16094_c0_g4::TRINITY_DN16094_c0_g4_i2::g.121630::m.121630